MTSTLAGLCVVGFLSRLSYGLARTPILPLFAASFGVGPEAIGFAVAISTVTGIFFKLPAGVLSDVIGRPRTLILGLGVFALVPLGYLWVASYEALVVVRFLHGFATAIYGPVAMAVVIDMAANKRAEMLSWFSSVTIIGNLVGAPLGGLLLTVMSGDASPRLTHFHMIYSVVASCGMVALFLALWLLRGELTSVGRHPDGRPLPRVFSHFRTAVSEILTDRRVLLTSNMEGVQNLAVGALEAFLPIYAVVVCGFSEFQAGLLWGGQILAVIAMKPIMGRLSDQHGRSPLLFWGMFACAIPFALLPWVQEFSLLMALVVCFGLGEAMVTSSAAAMVADFCQEGHLGSAMGAFGTLFDIGHASGPLLAGVLLGLSGSDDFRSSFGIVATILIMAACAFGVGVMTGKRQSYKH